MSPGSNSGLDLLGPGGGGPKERCWASPRVGSPLPWEHKLALVCFQLLGLLGENEAFFVLQHLESALPGGIHLVPNTHPHPHPRHLSFALFFHISPFPQSSQEPISVFWHGASLGGIQWDFQTPACLVCQPGNLSRFHVTFWPLTFPTTKHVLELQPVPW